MCKQTLQQQWSDAVRALTGYLSLVGQDGSRADVDELVSQYEAQANELVEWAFGIYRAAPEFLAENSNEGLEVQLASF